jgi:predicted LPLAT superfamily acyltransferase
VASWKGQSRGNILGYRIFVTLLKNAGIKPAYFILQFVALYYFFFAPSSFRNAFQFYRHKLGFGFFRSVLAVYRNYYIFGQVLLDKFATLAGFHSKFTFNFDGEQYLREMADAKTGCLLISAHLGNFEMAGHMLERLESKVNIIMLDSEHQHIKKYLTSFTHKSFHVISIQEDNSHIYEINRALKNKEIFCIHGDRFMQGSKTLACEFLGEKADFPSGPFYLAMKYGIPVSFVFAMKEGRSHYHFYATSPRSYLQQANPGKRDEMLRSIIRDYTREMESKLRKYPYQWFNFYNFWASCKKTEP